MTREDLKGLRYSQEWVKRQIERYEEQKTIAMNISQSIDGMPKAQNKPSYAIENLIDQYNELLKILAEEQNKINLIIIHINHLKPLHRTILSKRYIDGLNFETIATEIGYDYYNTCKLHGQALKEFDYLEEKMKLT